MSLQEHNITILKGNDVRLEISFKQADGTPLDLTGYTVKSQIRDKASQDGNLIAEFTDAFFDSDPTTGTIVLTLSDTETAAIVQQSGYYDVLLVDAADDARTYLKGAVKFLPTVTVK